MLHVTLPREGVQPIAHTAEIAGLIPFTETTYINKTGQTVYIADRHGAYMPIPSLPAAAKLDGEFQVVISWHTTLYAPVTFGHQNAQQHKTIGPTVCKRASTKYTMKPENYLGNDVIYSAELNVLISFVRPLDRTDVFPNTPGCTRRNNQHLIDGLDKTDALNINIIIVDNISPGAPYYLNIENRVYKLHSKTSEESEGFPDGVHIIDSVSPVGGHSDTTYGLKECIYNGDGKYNQPVTLFTNPHDAKTNGNRTALMEAEAHERELELKRQEGEILTLKQLLNAAKEESLLRKEKLDANSDVRKDYYEGKSHSRKDTSESFSMTTKVITGICTLGVAAFGLVKLLL